MKTVTYTIKKLEQVGLFPGGYEVDTVSGKFFKNKKFAENWCVKTAKKFGNEAVIIFV